MQSRTIPAKEYMQSRDNEQALARYWQRRMQPVPKLKATVYHRHKEAIAHMPTSNDLRATLTESKRRLADTFADGPHTDKVATFLLPSVSVPKAPQSLIRYICYSRPDNPLLMLYGAVIASIRAFDRTPDVLFISTSQERALAEETQRVTGRKYDGRFYCVDSRAVAGNIKSYPVLTENDLPDQLMQELHGYIAHDTVVVAIER